MLCCGVNLCVGTLNMYANCTYSDSLRSQFPKGFCYNENKMCT